MLKASIFTQCFPAHPDYCSRLFKQFVFKQEDKIFTVCRISGFPAAQRLTRAVPSAVGPRVPLSQGEGRGLLIPQHSEVCDTPGEAELPNDSGGRFSSPGEMTPGLLLGPASRVL